MPVNRETAIIDIKGKRRKIARNRFIIIIALAVAILLAMILSLLAQTHGMHLGEMFLGIFGLGSGQANVIVGNIRLRRVLAALIAGAGLTASGAIMQSSLRNEMASPSTLGVSEAATFGANLSILFLSTGSFSQAGLSISNPYAVSSFAFIFALVTTLLVLGLSKIRRFAPEIVALSGIALGMLFQALTNLIQYFSSDNALASAIYWTFGDLTRASFGQIGIMGVVVLASLIAFSFLAPGLNAIEEGDEIAKSLGVNIELTRFTGLILASLITAVCVSFVGIIGFIGLVIPQMMKRLLGSDNRFLIPISALVGSLSLILCDLLSRLLMEGTNLPVGAITSIIGAPIFIYILLSQRRVRR